MEVTHYLNDSMNDSKRDQTIIMMARSSASMERKSRRMHCSSTSSNEFAMKRYSVHRRHHHFFKPRAALISMAFIILFLIDNVVESSSSSSTLLSAAIDTSLDLGGRQGSQYHQSLRSASTSLSSSTKTRLTKNRRKRRRNTVNSTYASSKTNRLNTSSNNNSHSNDHETIIKASRTSLIRKKTTLRKIRRVKENKTKGAENEEVKNKGTAEGIDLNKNNRIIAYNSKETNKENNKGGNKVKTDPPTIAPSKNPTSFPSSMHSKYPSSFPSSIPSKHLSSLPSSTPTNVPTDTPTKSPTFFPTTSQPTIKKGNPTPVPTRWDESFVEDEGLVLTLSTLTADEDQLEFVKKSQDVGGRNRRNQSIGAKNSEESNLLADRVMKRIYKEDILNGNEQDFVKDVVSTMADVLCKYTDLVIVYKLEKNEENDGAQYSDYCKKDASPIPNINSYYTNRDTVILLPLESNDMSKIKLRDFQVFEQSIKNNYLHWIQWSITCPIVQISKHTLNEKQQNVDKALEIVKKEARLVMDTTISSDEVRDILMSKNQHVLSVSANGWEVVESINFIQAREAARDDDENDDKNVSDKDGILDPDNGKETNSGWIGFFQPIRIVGAGMMILLFTVLLHLIRAGKRRDDKIWEAKKAAPMKGDLVSHEGMNYLLQSSRVIEPDGDVSQQSVNHSSSTDENDPNSPNKEKDELTRLVAPDKSSLISHKNNSNLEQEEVE